MKNIIVLFASFYVLFITSCGEEKNKQIKNQPKLITDVTSYTGNAFIFIDAEIYRARVFIIPVKEQDSTKFKKLSIAEGIKGRLCIQMFFGHTDLLKLFNNKSQEIINYRACNLPKDSMFVSRVFISYKNCTEIKRTKINEDIKTNKYDSCNTKMVERSDSTQFFFSIYN